MNSSPSSRSSSSSLDSSLSYPLGMNISKDPLFGMERNTYQVVGHLGSGGFGDVYRVTSSGGHSYALKALKPARQLSLKIRRGIHRMFTEEVTLHALVADHPHILPYHGNFYSSAGDELHLLSEVCEGGDLDDLISARKFAGYDDEVKRVFLQVVSAVSHCHARGVAHRDIKPENILSKDSQASTFYLCDFGLALHQRWCSGFGAGSMPFMSPEALGATTDILAGGYDAFASDVWSLGILLLEMVSDGATAWDIAHPVQDTRYGLFLRNRAQFLRNEYHLREDFIPVVLRMLEPNPAERITAEEIVKSFDGVSHLRMTGWEYDLNSANQRAAARRDMYDSNVVHREDGTQSAFWIVPRAAERELTLCFALAGSPECMRRGDAPSHESHPKAPHFARLLRKLGIRV